MSDPKDDFVEHLYQLERKVDAISNHPQLGNASVHGRQIDFYDRDNNRIGSIGGDNGLGFDYEDGPEPPTPAPPVVSADAGVIAVEWAGQWADGREPTVSDPDVSRTRDLEGVEIHVSRDPLFEPDVVSMQGMFTAADGGSYAVGPMHEPGEYCVRLRARSRSGKVSAPSEMVAVEVAAALIDLQLAEMQVRTIEAQESADGKSRIFRGPTEPDPSLGPFNTGDTWFNTADSNMPSQWDGERWVSVADGRVGALEQAQADLRTEIENISVTAGGNTITRSASQPGASPGVEGDTWFVLLDGNVVEQWHHDGSGWVTSELASSVIADLHAGKITSGYIDSARIEAGSLVADTVLVPGSAGSTVIRDGAVTTEKIAAGAITAESGIIGSLDVGKVVTGELDGMFIKAGAITAEKIESGAVTATALSADAIDGKTITGATIRTSSSFPRVEINRDGLRQYDENGSPVSIMDGGFLSVVGSFATGFEGERRVEMRKNLWSTGAGLLFLQDGEASSASTAQFQSRIGAPFAGRLEIASSETSNGTRNRIQLDNDGWLEVGSVHLDGFAEQGAFSRLSLRNKGIDDRQEGAVFSIGRQDSNAWINTSYLALIPENLSEHWTGETAGTALLRAAERVVLWGRDSTRFVVDPVQSSFYTQGDIHWRTHGGNFRMYSFTTDGNYPGGELRLTDSSMILQSGGVSNPGRIDVTSYGEPIVLTARTSGSSQVSTRSRLELSDSWEIGRSNGKVTGTVAGSVSIDSSGFAEFKGGGGAVFQSHNTNKDIKFINTAGFQFQNAPTGTGSTVVMNSNGWIYRNSSSEKNKLVVEDIDYGMDNFEDRLLNITARSWIEKGDAERYAQYLDARSETMGPIDEFPNQAPPRRVPGAIAEEVHSAGLSHFVIYDDEGNPDGLHYDRFGIALIPVVARLRDRVESLEAALAAR